MRHWAGFLSSQCSFWGAVFNICSGKEQPGAPAWLPGPCSCPAVQPGMQHGLLGTTCASLIPAAPHAFALLSDLERRSSDLWRLCNELQSSSAGAGWPGKPALSTGHSHPHSCLVEVGIPAACVVWGFTGQTPVRSKASPGTKLCCLSPFQPSLTYRLLVRERCRASHCRNPSLRCCWNSEGWN